MRDHDTGSRWFSRLALLFALALAAGQTTRSCRAASSPPHPLTLEQAVEQALRVSPVLAAREAEVRRAGARLITARTFPTNPEILLEAADRRAPIGSSTDWAVGISQELEIGGQRGKRVAVAESVLAAARSTFERERRLLDARVAMAFAGALRARELLEIAAIDGELTRELLDYAGRRLEAGAGTQIQLNVARSTAGQSERALGLAESLDETAGNRLAETIGLSAETRVEPVGDLPRSEADLPPLARLVEVALENRVDLEALRQETESAHQEIGLSRSLAIPNLRFGAFYKEEEATDEIRGLVLSLPIPLFNRNQGEVAEARAEAARLSSEIAAAELVVRREVADALAIYRAAQRTANTLEDLVVGTLEENLTLLQRALEAGKIGASDVLVFRRELVEGRRQFVEALSEAWMARITLDLATGRTALRHIPEQEDLR